MTISIELPAALPLSAADFVDVEAPDGVRLELVDGVVEVAAAAQLVWHSRIARRICEMLLRAGRDAEREIGVVLDGRTVRVPDVMRWRTRVAVDPDVSQVPADLVDLVVEVISPESVKRDRDRKPRDYAGAGIPALWLVERCPDDPADALVYIHDLTLHPGGREYVVTRRVRLSVLENES